MTDKEAMKQALFALDIVKIHYTQNRHVNEAITALKERLLEASMREVQRLGQEIEQEPYAYTYLGIKNDGSQHGPHLCWKPEYMDVMSHSKGAIAVPLYTHPPQRTEQEPVAFKIYKPTPPRHATLNVRDAELPWVYDQDPSSGNVASMWVTPV